MKEGRRARGEGGSWQVRPLKKRTWEEVGLATCDERLHVSRDELVAAFCRTEPFGHVAGQAKDDKDGGLFKKCKVGSLCAELYWIRL